MAGRYCLLAKTVLQAGQAVDVVRRFCELDPFAPQVEQDKFSGLSRVACLTLAPKGQHKHRVNGGYVSVKRHVTA